MRPWRVARCRSGLEHVPRYARRLGRENVLGNRLWLRWMLFPRR
jgi:hypothetical protein